jgi:hypothetical protein
MLDRAPPDAKPAPPPGAERGRKRALRRERDRRHYRRSTAELAVAPVEYSREMVDHLIRLHWLDRSKASDPALSDDDNEIPSSPRWQALNRLYSRRPRKRAAQQTIEGEQ